MRIMDELIWIAVWVGIGFVCYGIAKNKNRNEYVAFGVGVLTGIIGLIIYLLIDEKDEEKES